MCRHQYQSSQHGRQFAAGPALVGNALAPPWSAMLGATTRSRANGYSHRSPRNEGKLTRLLRELAQRTGVQIDVRRHSGCGLCEVCGEACSASNLYLAGSRPYRKCCSQRSSMR